MTTGHIFGFSPQVSFCRFNLLRNAQNVYSCLFGSKNKQNNVNIGSTIEIKIKLLTMRKVRHKKIVIAIRENQLIFIYNLASDMNNCISVAVSWFKQVQVSLTHNERFIVYNEVLVHLLYFSRFCKLYTTRVLQ